MVGDTWGQYILSVYIIILLDGIKVGGRKS